MARFLLQFYRIYTSAHLPFFSAALAYYALFSLTPLLFLLVGVFGFVLSGNPALKKAFLVRLIELTLSLFPTQPDLAQGLVNFLTRGAFPITLTSLLVLFWASSGFFASLAYALGVIFGGVSPRFDQQLTFSQIRTTYDSNPTRRFIRQGSQLWGVVRGRVAGLLAPLLLGFALILLALIGLVLSFVLRYLPAEFRELRSGFEVVLPFLGSFILYFMTYTLLPVPPPRLLAAVISAVIAAFAWEGMRLGLPLLLPRTQYYEVLYGPLAGFLLGLIGFYLTMWILLAGAVLARVLSSKT